MSDANTDLWQSQAVQIDDGSSSGLLSADPKERAPVQTLQGSIEHLGELVISEHNAFEIFERRRV